MQETIKTKLSDSFAPHHLLVENESNNHNVPEGSESHFKIIVVSDLFNDLALIKRHRLVNQCLESELKIIHALAIHTYTLQQWNQQQDKTLESPECRGGN